jgi:tellurite resistance protein TerC
MPNQIIIWIGFVTLVIILLVLDLCVFHRKARTIKIREALLLSTFWIILALVFNVVIYFWRGSEDALRFFTGYLLEKSLSVDNLFVFLLIFSYFRVPSEYQHKILFWGILGALIMRAIFIILGITLLQRFHWIIYIFGAFLVLTGIKMAFQKDKEIHPEKNIILKAFKKLFPVSENYSESRFFIKGTAGLMATPLLVVLLVVETTDIIFAVDSVPAILAITQDTFIVYTSNVFAMLGLRALFFVLSGIMRLFHYLHYGLSIMLVFIGVKMLISEVYKIPILITLSLVALILVICILLSIIRNRFIPLGLK